MMPKAGNLPHLAALFSEKLSHILLLHKDPLTNTEVTSPHVWCFQPLVAVPSKVPKSCAGTCQRFRRCFCSTYHAGVQKKCFSEDATGGWKKRGGWKTSRMTPLPKRGFGPPLVRYVFHPPQVSVLCFSCTEIHDTADQKLFWRGPKIFGRARSLVRFPPPIRFAPPHITAQVFGKLLPQGFPVSCFFFFFDSLD